MECYLFAGYCFSLLISIFFSLVSPMLKLIYPFKFRLHYFITHYEYGFKKSTQNAYIGPLVSFCSLTNYVVSSTIIHF